MANFLQRVGQFAASMKKQTQKDHLVRGTVSLVDGLEKPLVDYIDHIKDVQTKLDEVNTAMVGLSEQLKSLNESLSSVDNDEIQSIKSAMFLVGLVGDMDVHIEQNNYVSIEPISSLISDIGDVSAGLNAKLDLAGGLKDTLSTVTQAVRKTFASTFHMTIDSAFKKHGKVSSGRVVAILKTVKREFEKVKTDGLYIDVDATCHAIIENLNDHRKLFFRLRQKHQDAAFEDQRMLEDIHNGAAQSGDERALNDHLDMAWIRINESKQMVLEIDKFNRKLESGEIKTQEVLVDLTLNFLESSLEKLKFI